MAALIIFLVIFSRFYCILRLDGETDVVTGAVPGAVVVSGTGR